MCQNVRTTSDIVQDNNPISMVNPKPTTMANIIVEGSITSLITIS